MAAGLGTRLKPFTLLQSKAFLPLLGVPIAQFAIDSFAAQGIQEVSINVHAHAEKSKLALTQLKMQGMKLSLSDETSFLLGSAGGVKQAASQFKKKAQGESQDFLLSNADVLSSINWNSLIETHLALKKQWGVHLTLNLFNRSSLDEGADLEIFFNSSGLMTGLGSITQGRPFYSGAAILEPEALSQVPPFGSSEFLTHILEPKLKDKKVGVCLDSGHWYDIGSPLLWFKTHLALIELLEL